MVELTAIFPPPFKARKFAIVNLHSITDALPEGANSTYLHGGEFSPLIFADPCHGFCHEDAESIQEIILQDFTRLLISAVKVVHACDCLENTLVCGRMGSEFINEKSRICIALTSILGSTELLCLDEETGYGWNAISLIPRLVSRTTLCLFARQGRRIERLGWPIKWLSDLEESKLDRGEVYFRELELRHICEDSLGVNVGHFREGLFVRIVEDPMFLIASSETESAAHENIHNKYYHKVWPSCQERTCYMLSFWQGHGDMSHLCHCSTILSLRVVIEKSPIRLSTSEPSGVRILHTSAR